MLKRNLTILLVTFIAGLLTYDVIHLCLQANWKELGVDMLTLGVGFLLGSLISYIVRQK